MGEHAEDVPEVQFFQVNFLRIAFFANSIKPVLIYKVDLGKCVFGEFIRLNHTVNCFDDSLVFFTEEN